LQPSPNREDRLTVFEKNYRAISGLRNDQGKINETMRQMDGAMHLLSLTSKLTLAWICFGGFSK